MERKRGGGNERERCNLRGLWWVSETAINYVCAEAPGIRVAGLLKLKGTFVSPIVELRARAWPLLPVLRY